MPKSCGSYHGLPDDNSMLASQCGRWVYQSSFFVGKWSGSGVPYNTRLFNHAAFVGHKYHWIIHHQDGRWECDDFHLDEGYTASSGDFWKIFVR